MQHNKYVAAHVDLLWDVTNFWAPYRESKVFRLIPWVGFGYAQRFKTTESYDRPRTESPTLNAGILTAFRLSKRVDLNVEIQGSLLNEQFNRVEMNHLTDGIVQLSAGLTFKLGKTDFEVLEPMDYALLNDLNGQINSLRAANDELSKRPVSCPECQETVTEVVNNYVDNVVYFRINSAKIDKNQQINIYNTAEFMKNNNAPIKVVGYAERRRVLLIITWVFLRNVLERSLRNLSINTVSLLARSLSSGEVRTNNLMAKIAGPCSNYER